METSTYETCLQESDNFALLLAYYYQARVRKGCSAPAGKFVKVIKSNEKRQRTVICKTMLFNDDTVAR